MDLSSIDKDLSLSGSHQNDGFNAAGVWPMLIYPLFLLSGCTLAPPPDFRPTDIYPGSVHLDYNLHEVSVRVAGDSEQTGAMRLEGIHEQDICEYWKEGVEDALFHSAVFKNQGGKRINVHVEILEFHAPLFAATVRTKVVAQYQVILDETGKVVYSDRVESVGVVPSDFAFVGVVRFRESMNRAAKENMKKFIERLEERGLQQPQ